MAGIPWTAEEIESLIAGWKGVPGALQAYAREFASQHGRSQHGAYYQLKQLQREGKLQNYGPAILLIDIETLPIISYHWGMYNQFIQNDNIIKDWCLLSWAAMWLGEERVFADVLTPKEAKARSDQRIAGSAWKLLERADIVVAHNGRKFDAKKLNARFIKHKMGPPSPYKLIDTLSVARSVAGFTSNKLDWLAQEVGAGQKLETGMELWRQCDAGDPEALTKMLDYNMHDISILEGFYMEIRPWIVGHPDVNMYTVTPAKACPVCGGAITDIGPYPTQKRKKRAFRCVDCGAVGRAK